MTQDAKDIRTQAKYLANAHKHMSEEDLIIEVAKTMRQHYILGGVAAIDAFTESLPAEQLMDAPPDARQMISAMLTVCEKFRAVMVEKLSKR